MNNVIILDSDVDSTAIATESYPDNKAEIRAYNAYACISNYMR